MKLFECQHCGQPLYFENIRCESCGRGLGYLPAAETISALEEGKRGLRALAERKGRYRYCANSQFGTCNWLVSVDSPEQFCAACRHNRMIPDLSLPENQANWRKIELAKHRLFYTLLKLRLPLQTKLEDPEHGLAFDFLAAPPPNSAPAEPVMTGHDNGLITINLAEADDSERERMRRQMGEPYRTLLGHFRHEIAHYYWDRLVQGRARHRSVPGRCSATNARITARRCNGTTPTGRRRIGRSVSSPPTPAPILGRIGPRPGRTISTWSTRLETASAFGMRVRPRVTKGADLSTAIDFDPHSATSGPHRRLLVAADLRGQFDQPQHGHRRPLSVRPGAAGDRQVVVHPRSDSSGGRAAAARSGPRGAPRRDRQPEAGRGFSGSSLAY